MAKFERHETIFQLCPVALTSSPEQQIENDVIVQLQHKHIIVISIHAYML